MTKNEQLIQQFYTFFKNKDYSGMSNCYAANATFSDPVFQNLQGEQIGKMWEMLIKRGHDLQLEFSNIQELENTTSADWVATYTFSATGKKVTNRIQANFVIENDKIVLHRDNFSFYKWARQAFGFAGLLFGWTGFLKESVRQKARKGLYAFIQKNASN
ncbi:MAG: nuclear transport factor 2 family protein [Saprospiraceae bacterium]